MGLNEIKLKKSKSIKVNNVTAADTTKESDDKSEDEVAKANKEKKNDKSGWKNDKVLNFKVIDTDSEEEKINNSIEKKKSKNDNKNEER